MLVLNRKACGKKSNGSRSPRGPVFVALLLMELCYWRSIIKLPLCATGKSGR